MPISTSPTARQREVYRYYQPLETSAPSAGQRGEQDGPRSSADPVLTAFAQLGAHRLKAKRGLITLSTRDTEYVLAEAGVGMNLQQDDDKNDPLWHGATALKNGCGLGMELCKMFCSSEDELPCLVLNDLRKCEMSKNKVVVTEGPKLRFLAAVPLRSPLYNMIIGTYIVVDDKPRDGLSEDEIEFMVDMGVTVMDHLEAQRNNRKQHRSERMMKAIGLFIEGKSSLREWWLQGGYKAQQTTVRKRTRNGATTLDGQADLEFGIQDPVEHLSSRGMESFSDHGFLRSPSSSTLSLTERPSDGRPRIPNRDSTFSASDTTIPSTVFSGTPGAASVTTVETTEGSTTERVRHSSVAFDMPPENGASDVSKELQEALLTKDLKAVFSRASNLIREASGVDGSIFYDASIGSFGAASEKDLMGQKAPGNFHVDETNATSEDDIGRRSSDTDTSNKLANDAEHAENCCNLLGFSTRKRSSLKGHSPPSENQTFPERVLRTLIKRYPHGKVFNFDEDGSFSSSDTDNAYLGDKNGTDGPSRFSKAETISRKRRVSREIEAAALLKALPGARSIFWFPLWDPTKERFFSGSLVWTTSPTRTLCPIEDLTYLAAFGNSIMAEVARLSALVITQMKTDFISSISHELRSPLHGVLASVEFLQETSLTEVQADMVSNINASGRVLLDTINHVLDFSKVNKKVKNRGKGSRSRNGKKQRISSNEHEKLDNTPDTLANMCVLSEEVVESVWAGRNMTKLAYGATQVSSVQSLNAKESPVTVIMDIAWRQNWIFDMDAGAWRRILLNLFGNAMKYTKSGYIKVSLTIENNATLKGKRVRSLLLLKVKDSGKGISKEFLKHHLYKPFTQEDSLAVGAGLGLSIVRHIIQDLGGEINFASEQGVGTEATLKLPLLAAPPRDSHVADMVTEVKHLTKGKMFMLEGFDRYPDLSDTPTGILSADVEAAMLLKCSVHEMLVNWFCMEQSTVSAAADCPSDLIFIMQSGVQSLLEKFQSYGSRSRPSIAIVLCNTYPPSSTQTIYGSLRVFYVPQPYGPHKVAKTLHHAFTATTTPISMDNNTGHPNAVPSIPSVPIADTLPTGAVFHAPLIHDSVTPMALESVPTPSLNPPATNTSIDTSIMQSGGMRVLLVEDNEINMKLLVAYMRKLKLNHSTAINGLEALNAYKEAKGGFEVIFMDISMPIMSGIEATKHIRRFERENTLNPVALIALTGAANPNTRQEAFSSGVDLFLTKPVPMKSLKVMLDDLKVNGRQGLAA